MAGVSVSGSGSNIDFSLLIDAIVAQRMRPVSQLQSKSSDLSKRSDALKQLNTRLATLAGAAKALTDRDLGSGRQSVSSNLDVSTVSSTEAAPEGTFKLNVTRLASSLSQSSRIYNSSASAVLAGGAASAAFELRKGGASSGTSITIDSSNNTLEGLRDAINNAEAGVTASIVDVNGEGSYKLILNSTATGSAGRVELVETSSTGSGTDLGLTSLNPPGASNDFSALNASFSINGLDLTRSSNEVSDAVSGLTFNLKGSGAATVTVAARTADVGDKIADFINAYNSVQEFVAGQYTKDAKGRPSGVLAGDPTLRTVQQQLRELVGGNSTANGGAFKNLTQIGVNRDDSGRLTLDTTALTEQLTKSFSDVKALLAGKSGDQTGVANAVYNTVSKLSDGGTVQSAIDGYQASVKRIDKSVSAQIERINDLRQSLTKQYAVADAAISQLNSQGTSLSSIIKSFSSSSDK
jgi:flagellar hook-associated protein 2